MDRGRRKAEGALPGPLSRDSSPILGDDAEAELLEILDYIARGSPRNARLVADRISKAVERIRRHPSAGSIDAEAPDVPDGATARKLTVSGYTIRYLYPFHVAGQPRSLVVSIRRGSRRALQDPQYVLRWLEERAKRTR